MGVDALVAAGRAALSEGRWDAAREAFEEAVTRDEPPEALDGLAEVRHRQGDYAAAIALRERAYAGFRARGDTRYPAVLAAYFLAFEYAAVYGNMAVARGWLERGRRLAAVSGDCPERGWVELAGVLATDDPAEKEQHIAAATRIARRFGDANLEFDALAYAGATLVEQGRVDEGMRRLDEAAAATRGGEVTSHTAAGEIHCKMLLACEMTLDVRRAQEWRDVAVRLDARTDMAWPSAICRMHYGGILTAAGRWSEAEEELATSVRLYDRSYRALRSGALVRLADLRVRQGRVDEAERLLDGHDHDAYAIRPLARLHLVRGQLDAAGTLLRRGLDGRGDTVLTAPVLALLAELETAAGRPRKARALAARLTAIAVASPAPVVGALAERAAGMASSDAAGAVEHLERAMAGFRAAGLPLEEAQTRFELARCLVDRDTALAVAEATAACAAFDSLGAARDADAAAALLRSLGASRRRGPKGVGALSAREQEVLHLLGLGLSNPEIAARLFISRKTASHHVSNVLAKLGLRNRSEAAAFAVKDAAGRPPAAR